MKKKHEINDKDEFAISATVYRAPLLAAGPAVTTVVVVITRRRGNSNFGLHFAVLDRFQSFPTRVVEDFFVQLVELYQMASKHWGSIFGPAWSFK